VLPVLTSQHNKFTTLYLYDIAFFSFSYYIQNIDIMSQIFDFQKKNTNKVKQPCTSVN